MKADLILALAAAALLGRFVWVCESDGQVVKPRDIAWRDGRGWHISERDRRGRIVTLCGVVHRARIGSGTAVGRVGDVK